MSTVFKMTSDVCIERLGPCTDVWFGHGWFLCLLLLLQSLHCSAVSAAFVDMQDVVAYGAGMLHILASIHAEGDQTARPATGVKHRNKVKITLDYLVYMYLSSYGCGCVGVSTHIKNPSMPQISQVSRPFLYWILVTTVFWQQGHTICPGASVGSCCTTTTWFTVSRKKIFYYYWQLRTIHTNPSLNAKLSELQTVFALFSILHKSDVINVWRTVGERHSPGCTKWVCCGLTWYAVIWTGYEKETFSLRKVQRSILNISRPKAPITWTKMTGITQEIRTTLQ